MTSLLRKIVLAAGLAVLMVANAEVPAADAAGAGGREIKYVVNGVPITSYDHPAACRFHQAAAQEERRASGIADRPDAAHLTEAKRLGIRVTDPQVDAAYSAFAKNNKMPVAQLDAVLEKSGVTKEHFKEFIRAQMAWSRPWRRAPRRRRRRAAG